MRRLGLGRIRKLTRYERKGIYLLAHALAQSDARLLDGDRENVRHVGGVFSQAPSVCEAVLYIAAGSH